MTFVGGCNWITHLNAIRPNLNRLPIKFSQLSRDSLLALTLWDVHDDPEQPHAIGGTTLPLFSSRGVFRKGIYDLRVWPFCEATGENASSIPGKYCEHANEDDAGQSFEHANDTIGSENGEEIPPEKLMERRKNETAKEMRRLVKLGKNHRNGLMPNADWLDRLAFREIEHIKEKHKRQSRDLYMLVEMPQIQVQGTPHLVVYFEKYADEIHHFTPAPETIKFYDAELEADNLVEIKHRMLTRSARAATVDRELKPAAVIRDQLEAIIASPSTRKLSQEHRDLIWKFRYHLSSNNKALGKFLQSVQWDRANEEKEALKLLYEWAPMEVEDSLQLLSSEFTHAAVRRYAVGRLSQAPSNDLQLYLLQLVQALKFESHEDIVAGSDDSFVRSFMVSDHVTTSSTSASLITGGRATMADLWQVADYATDAAADLAAAADEEATTATPSTAAAADGNEDVVMTGVDSLTIKDLTNESSEPATMSS